MYTPRMKHFCLIASVVLLTSVHAAHATTVIEMTFADLVAQAEGIAVGTVSDIREQWDATQQVPLTLVTFSNLTVLKGNPGTSMTLEFLGGTMPNGLVMVIPGVPRFTVGEKTVVFRTGNQREVCPLVGVWQGLLRVVNNPQQGVETVSDSYRIPLVKIQAGKFVKLSPTNATQETLSLPTLLQSIQHELQHPSNPS
ncbi:MAG: hypothetical protein HOP18_23410 [Deltaproteobacteria bacterium]|nr:hypothetical protein [Deltaproteobacteria bacterium]